MIKIVLEDKSKSGSISFSDYAVYQAITKLIQKYHGHFGVGTAKSGLKCKYCNDQTRIAIVRVKRDTHRFVTSVLPLASVVNL